MGKHVAKALMTMIIRALSTAIVIAIFFIHLLSFQVWGAEGVETERVFGFAESLFEEGDYFRAITEYKRYIFLLPDRDFADKASLRIAESYFRANRWQEAIESCNQFLDQYADSALYNEALYLKGRAEKQDKRFDDAMRTFDFIEKKNAPSYGDRAIYQKALIMVERSN